MAKKVTKKKVAKNKASSKAATKKAAKKTANSITSSRKSTTINLITQRPDGTFVLRIVEEGPWDDDTLDEELHRVQDRLYDCVDIAVDGHLASKYPESKGQAAVIRLDGYDIPRKPVQEFFQAFAEHVGNSDEVRDAMRSNGFVSSLKFEFSWGELDDKDCHEV